MYDIQKLTKIYGAGHTKVVGLDAVSLIIPDEVMMAIVGRSGSGKSTLLRQMGLLDHPTSGRIVFDGQDVSRLPESQGAKVRLKYLGYIFQEYALLGELTAHQNVYLPGMMLNGKGNNYKETAKDLLKMVGLGSRIYHRPMELSGGEQQRVAIARALINNPKVLLADEPCANLDTLSSKNVMETLVRLNKELKVTVVFVSHDPADKKYAQTVTALSDGKIVQEEPA